MKRVAWAILIFVECFAHVRYTWHD